MKTSEIRYIVDEPKRTVVAIVDGCMYDALEKIYRNGFMCSNAGALLVNGDRLLMPDTFRGVAKCHEMDIFDVSEGKRIARKKLLKYYHTSRANVVLSFLKSLENLHGRLSEYYSQISEE